MPGGSRKRKPKGLNRGSQITVSSYPIPLPGVYHVPTPTPPHLSLKAKLNFNLVVKRLQEASTVTAHKTGKRSVEKRRGTNVEPITSPPNPRRNAASEFSVFGHPSTHSSDRRHVHFQESAFRDNYAAPRHSAKGAQTRNRGGFRSNTRNDTLNFRGETRF
ncbi:hypothetical protein TNCV_1466061 [Trichonephila clavipes]|nr:hypothetical protein TNCV_1466061 [Trichonephila clavipes]